MQNFRAVGGCSLDNSNLSLIVNNVLPPHSRIALMIELNNVIDDQCQDMQLAVCEGYKETTPRNSRQLCMFVQASLLRH
jgi:hypothetical protein